MDTTNDFIISGFKNYKAVSVNSLTWSVIERIGGKPIGKIASLKTKEGDAWHFYSHEALWLSGEQLLDLSGLIKSVTRSGNPKPVTTPLDDRLTLYGHIKENWKQLWKDDTTKHSGEIREAYKHLKTGNQFYVSYHIKDGDIEEMNFYRTGSFTGKLSIKLIRMELGFIKKLSKT
jgi:hypothetical protein